MINFLCLYLCNVTFCVSECIYIIPHKLVEREVLQVKGQVLPMRGRAQQEEV